jgi:hypothetical protein
MRTPRGVGLDAGTDDEDEEDEDDDDDVDEVWPAAGLPGCMSSWRTTRLAPERPPAAM